jgi:hypothetical protein
MDIIILLLEINNGKITFGRHDSSRYKVQDNLDALAMREVMSVGY